MHTYGPGYWWPNVGTLENTSTVSRKEPAWLSQKVGLAAGSGTSGGRMMKMLHRHGCRRSPSGKYNRKRVPKNRIIKLKMINVNQVHGNSSRGLCSCVKEPLAHCFRSFVGLVVTFSISPCKPVGLDDEICKRGGEQMIGQIFYRML